MRPRWPTFLSGALLFVAIAVSARVAASGGGQDSQARAEQKNVSCRVLESHTSAERGVTIVIFHQSAKEDQAGLSNLLKQNEGTTIEWKSGDEKWHPATVMRLKSCFGRGLLVVPTGSAAPKEGETFLLKFPGAKAAAVK
jgi:hypothetical protein